MISSTRLYHILLMMMLSNLLVDHSSAEVVTFEELSGFTGASGQEDGQPGGSYYNGAAGSTGWSSQDAFFTNDHTVTPWGEIWSGWAYSDVQNSVTAGYANQYAAYPGGGSDLSGGVDEGGTYAIAFTGSQVDTTDAFVYFDSPTRVSSVDIANTTYLARWVQGSAPPFNPPPDAFDNGYLRLRIDGLDANGDVTGSQTQTLAEDDTFLLSEWTTTDLAELGTVWGLRFELESNKVTRSEFDGNLHLDPPAYFAMDNLTLTAVPEPHSMGLLALGTAAWAWRVRRRA